MKFLHALESKGERVPRGQSIASKVSIPYGRVGQPYQSSWSAERATKDGFERDLWVYKAVQTIAAAEARLPIRLTSDKRDDNKDYDDPLLPLLNVKANPIESARVFKYRASAQLLLSKKGVFVELVRNRGGELMELHLLPPDLTAPIPDEDDYVSGYEVMAGIHRFTLEPDRVLWIRRPHPLDPYAGSTPMEAAGLSIDTDFYARLYNRNFLQNDGRPAGLVGLKGQVDFAELRDLKRRLNGGPGKAGTVEVLDDIEDMTFMDLAKTPRDLQYKDLRIGTKEEVLGAFGVPESQTGNASGRTFDNADAEAVFFWAITMLDHNETMLEPFTMLRAEDNDDGRHFEHNVDNVEPLQRLKRAERDEDRKDVEAGIMTREEYREKWGQDPTGEDGAKALYIMNTMKPITGQAAKDFVGPATVRETVTETGNLTPGGEGATPGGRAAPAAAAANATTAPTGTAGGAGAAKPKLTVIAGGKATTGAKALVPGAEEWGLHEVKAAAVHDGEVGITWAGPLLSGETLYYPANLGLKFFDEEAHPRDEGGKFSIGGGSVSAGPASPEAIARAFHSGHVDFTAKPAAIPDAATLLERLSKGETVSVKPGDVNTLLDVMASKAQSGKDFDLATVAVAGQMIFHGEGPARAEMPQIPSGDAKEKFLAELAAKGVTAQDKEVAATQLRPTQREISGAKVTGMIAAVEKGKLDLSSERILVSKDGYVLDGHHRWAAAVGVDYEDGHAGDIKIPVTVVNEDMHQLLPDANAFVDREHIGRVAFGMASGAAKAYPWLFYGPDDFAARDTSDLERDGDPLMSGGGANSNILVTSTKALDVLVRQVKGDVAGHDFHGNQWTGGQGGGDTGTGAHAVGVSADPYSQSLKTLTKGQQPGESPKDYNDRIFREGLEHYAPAHEVEREASDVRAELGIPNPKVSNWTGIEANWDRAQQVGQAFAAAKSDPNNPEVKAAYADLVSQTQVQWDHLTSPESEGGLGVTVDFVSPDEIRDKYGDKEGLNPYPTAKDQRDDIVNNNHLAIASISDYPEASHPLLTNERGGEYDRFRAVHDAFGHAAIGADFTRHGEYEAWLHHTSMFFGPGRLAASTELTGENSYLVTTHQPAEHKAALLDPDLIANPWASDGQLVSQWKSLRQFKSVTRKGPGRVGGEAEIVRDYGVTNSRNALYGQIAKSKA